MRAEADRNPTADDFCDAAEGVAVRLRGVDSGNHLFLGCAIQSAQRRRVGGCVEVRRHLVGAARVDPSQVHNMAPQGDAELAEKAPADGSRGLSLIHISEPTRLGMISYAVFCLKKKKKKK